MNHLIKDTYVFFYEWFRRDNYVFFYKWIRTILMWTMYQDVHRAGAF